VGVTDIEQKALVLLSEVNKEIHGNPGWYEGCNRTNASPVEALCRAIEQHEAFRKEVSDAAEVYEEMGCPMGWEGFEQFIIRKPDPLVKVLNEISHEGGFDNFNHYAHRLRAALEARGFEIREKSDG
jgi:hypothetical protein